MQTSSIKVSLTGRVYLNLPNKNYKSRRCLGQIIEDAFHCQRNPEHHLFRQFGGSYGFNYELLRDGSFVFVVVHLAFGGELVTTRQHLLKIGQFLNFQRNKLEKQIFCPVNEINLDEIEVEERKSTPAAQKAEQLPLFNVVEVGA